MNVLNKLECLSLASFSVLVWCMWVRPGTYSRVEHLKVLSSGRLRQTLADSGRLRQTLADSGRLRQTPADSGRLRQTPADSADSGRLRQTPALLTHIGPRWRGLAWTNTLAYYKHLYITNIKSFITLVPGGVAAAEDRMAHIYNTMK